MPLRLLFMGTGTFALPAFRALVASDHDVVALITQPDRTTPRGKLHPHPMKEFALESAVEVFQPQNINTQESVERLRAFEADLAVVAAYGQILKPDVLSATRLGAVNLHASLLPKYRGAAPVQYSLLHGETETGVTIFQIEPKLDAGPILDVAKRDVPFEMTSGELEEKLSELAVPLALRVVQNIEAGTVTKTMQDASLVTKAPRLKKSDGRIDWSKTSAQIHNHMRAMNPWPKPFTFLHHAGSSQRVIVPRIDFCDAETTNAKPGEIIRVDKHHVVVATGDGAVEVRSIQPEGKRVMNIDDFLAGHTVRVGDWFE